MKFKLVLILFIFFIGSFYLIDYFTQPKKLGCVVILNGVSSSGKSTLQHLISNFRTKEFWISFGFDYGVGKVLPQYTYSHEFASKSPDYFCQNIRCDDKNGPCVRLKYGPFGNQLLEALHRAIRAYAKQGINVAVDYLAYGYDWAQDLNECLKDIPHVWVKVYGDPQKLIEREKNRPGAVLGLARPYINVIHENILYDLEIDTTSTTPEESLNKLNKAIDKVIK